MATLNIKNLPDPLYRKLKARARRARRSLAQQVIYLMIQALEEPDELSILGLRGLGKETWEQVDVTAHVNLERTSWD